MNQVIIWSILVFIFIIGCGESKDIKKSDKNIEVLVSSILENSNDMNTTMEEGTIEEENNSAVVNRQVIENNRTSITDEENTTVIENNEINITHEENTTVIENNETNIVSLESNRSNLLYIKVINDVNMSIPAHLIEVPLILYDINHTIIPSTLVEVPI